MLLWFAQPTFDQPCRHMNYNSVSIVLLHLKAYSNLTGTIEDNSWTTNMQ